MMMTSLQTHDLDYSTKVILQLNCYYFADLLLLNQHFSDSWSQPTGLCNHWSWCHQHSFHCYLCK